MDYYAHDCKNLIDGAAIFRTLLNHPDHCALCSARTSLAWVLWGEASTLNFEEKGTVGEKHKILKSLRGP